MRYSVQFQHYESLLKGVFVAGLVLRVQLPSCRVYPIAEG